MKKKKKNKREGWSFFWQFYTLILIPHGHNNGLAKPLKNE
jgi:hypothetical protein